MANRKVNLTITVDLDQSNVPSSIQWSSDDPPSNGQLAEAKAFFLSVFDTQTLETLKIDLWTPQLEIGEMNRLMYYSIRSMSESYHRATNNAALSNDIARFAQYFAEEVGILKKSDS